MVWRTLPPDVGGKGAQNYLINLWVFLQTHAFVGDGVAQEQKLVLGGRTCALPYSEYILSQMRGLRFFVKHEQYSFPLAVISAARSTHSSLAMEYHRSTLAGLVCSQVLVHPLQRNTILAIAARVKVCCYKVRPFVAETSSGVTPNRRQSVGTTHLTVTKF